jgi:hypothetical protein
MAYTKKLCDCFAKWSGEHNAKSLFFWVLLRVTMFFCVFQFSFSFFVVFLEVLGFELRALGLLGKQSTT